MARITFPSLRTLKSLFHIVSPIEYEGDDTVISGLCNDSRECLPGDLFIAVSGSSLNSAQFITQAISKGAAAVLVSKADVVSESIPFIRVKDTKKIISELAGFLLDSPSMKLTVIGVTGTNGKTTTSWIAQHMLESVGIRALRIGTLGAEIKDVFFEDFGLTTPDPIKLQSLLFEAVKLGAKAVVMEVSSHALHQSRVNGIHFDGVIFTNLTRDHLDYHGTEDEYYKAKASLFSLLKTSKKTRKISIIAGHDHWSERAFNDSLASIKNTKKISHASEVSITLEGSSFKYENNQFKTPYVGLYNIENFLCAYEALKGLGFAISKSESLPAVPGRLEQVSKGIFIDYAHTPDALENALSTLRKLTSGKLIVAFGCGGDRDKGKRKIMGEISSRLADKVIITSDNPRTEDPSLIIEDIAEGSFGHFEKIVDRREAIQNGVRLLSDGDIFLIAGKGHEEYQVIGTEKKHFSDKEEVLKFLSPGGAHV